MKVNKPSFHRVITLAAIVAMLFTVIAVSGLLFSTQAWASTRNAPLAAPAAAPLPATTCTLVGTDERVCDFWAKEGVLDLPGGDSVPIWGFSDTAGGNAQLPGAPIIVNQGELVTVNLTNELPSETVSLMFFGQEIAPDMVGVAPAGTTSYSFTATEPGTFRYEAGLTPNGARQVAMGMYGALIVRPTVDPTGQAYEGANSAYDQEALLVLSEIDTDFHADPNGFDMTLFKPDYWLINGRAYSQTEKIEAATGESVLLRYVNSGLQEHTLGVLGLHQTVLSNDGQPYLHTKEYVAQTMGGGQTSDALVEIPGTAVINTHYAIYNTGLQQLHNNGTSAFGGIMTFIETTNGDPKPVGGPLATNLSVSPNPVTINEPVTLTATLDSTTTSGLDVTEWEYFINSTGADGSGTLMAVSPTAATTTVSAIVSAAELTSVPTGDVTFYIHGKDANGTWGAFNSVVLDMIGEGPVITGISLNSNPANGEQPVGIQATANATTVGDTTIDIVEYFIGTPGTDGNGIAMDIVLSQEGAIGSLTTEIDAATILALPEGIHTIHIHAKDALGNWGGYGTIDLVVDKTGPVTSNPILTPNPNNGNMSVNSSSSGVLLEIDLADDSIIETAEAFINYTNPISNPHGTGFALIANDGVYNSTNETAYFIIPLTTVRFLEEGDHTVDFHGKDVAGNWGDMGTATLTIDKTGPTTSNVVASPNPVRRGRWVSLTATSTDTNAVVAAEWFEGADPGVGQGHAMAITSVGGNSYDIADDFRARGRDLRPGLHTISVRTQDALGNWGDVETIELEVLRRNGNAALVADGFETNNLSEWDVAAGDVSVNLAAALSGNLGMEASLDAGEPAYVQAQFYDEGKGLNISFDFAPNDIDTGGEEQNIFVARDEFGTEIFGIMFEQNATDFELMAWALQDDGTTMMTEGVHITNDAYHVNLIWDQATDDLSLLVDGVLEVAISEINGATYQVDDVRLGLVSNAAANTSGSMYFDTFVLNQARYDYYFPILMQSE